MAEKVTFDGTNKLIVVDAGVTDINVERDLYAAWKRWFLTGDGSQWEIAFKTTGGEAINQAGTQFAPKFFFLSNGWRLVVNNGLTVNIAINLYPDPDTGASNIYVISEGSVVNAKLSDATIITADSTDYTAILNILQQFNFSGGDVVATLDGEKVSTDDESRQKSKADIWAL